MKIISIVGTIKLGRLVDYVSISTDYDDMNFDMITGMIGLMMMVITAEM